MTALWRMRSEGKLRFALILPLIQVPITAIFTLWADRVHWMLLGSSNRAPGPYVHLHLFVVFLNDIWHGINTPALPLVGGLAQGGEAIYLICVFLMWWVIGRAIDRRRGLLPFPSSAREIRFAVFAMVWGALILVVAISGSYGLALGCCTSTIELRLAPYVLQAVWSIVLFALGTQSLRRSLAKRRFSAVEHGKVSAE